MGTLHWDVINMTKMRGVLTEPSHVFAETEEQWMVKRAPSLRKDQQEENLLSDGAIHDSEKGKHCVDCCTEELAQLSGEEPDSSTALQQDPGDF